MTVIADLHLHSRYSNSTSPEMTLPTLSHWARRKGVDLLGTGDFTHPQWMKSLTSGLRDRGNGIYRYEDMDFLLTGEVSLVWRQDERGRRIHLILLVPSLDDAMRINGALSGRGNLAYDGRPMLGLSAHDFCEVVWEQSSETMIIPAHAWTPWYAVFGAKSGFDSLVACFGDYTDRICAIETGLSSDPPMNRRVSALDDVRLISCSDAHSPAKLAREATLFDVSDVCFDSIAHALKTGEGYAGTLEFYPQEGKYHYDGHRACGVSRSPEESTADGNICPVCGKTLTIGVLHRIQELADRQEPKRSGVSFRSLIPLDEIISQAIGVGVQSKAVAKIYDFMVERHGSELNALLDHPLDGFSRDIPERVVEGIAKMRCGDVVIEPGYDGVYGKIRIPFCGR
jgi:uncharacterized protein (TIGR00375 family)